MNNIHLCILMSIILVGCTQNITTVHTQGEATDVVDTEQSPTNDVKADLEIPLHPVGL